MKKIFLLISLLLLTGCTNPLAITPKPTPVVNDETKAVTAAKTIYDQKYGNLTDEQKVATLQDGPCLSNDIYPDWVVDIVHQPRQPQDNDPKNQCTAYLQGQAHHFIELDEYGNFLRAY